MSWLATAALLQHVGFYAAVTAPGAPAADPWLVGAFGSCGVGPPDAVMDQLRAFQTLNFCTEPTDLVQAHRKGMTGFLHIGLVTNSSGERIWNVGCDSLPPSLPPSLPLCVCVHTYFVSAGASKVSVGSWGRAATGADCSQAGSRR